MNRVIRVFDTTLRDGEQSPGCSMNIEEKLMVARQLAKMKVDIIEAGFPASSPGDFAAVMRIAQEFSKGELVIAGLCRAAQDDIDACWQAIKLAANGRIHTFLATSDIHLQHKLKKTREEALQMAVAAVKHARRYTEDVEFSAEDATRSDLDYLARVVEAVIKAGATTVNIPDTVGYAVPAEYGERIKYLVNNVPNIHRAVISVHCHNDLGNAVANSLAGVLNGAGQVESTINGIGERAGNAAMEEVVMNLRVREAFFEARTNVVTEEITAASRLLRNITGMHVQANKAVVGKNAFAHEAGIHQDGFLKEKSTYEIMTPASVGRLESSIVLGKHSGRAGLKNGLQKLGYELSEADFLKVFERFKRLADQKKEIFDEDLVALVSEEVYRVPKMYGLLSVYTSGGTKVKPEAVIVLKVNGKRRKKTCAGDGPVDAGFKAIARLTKTASEVLAYEVKAITGGTDAQGEVHVRLRENGLTATGVCADTDIIVASAKAYVNALNNLALLKVGPSNGKNGH